MNKYDNYYCTHCGCLVGNHDDTGCICENDEAHSERNSFAMDGLNICTCERSYQEIISIDGWRSEYEGANLNGTERHS